MEPLFRLDLDENAFMQAMKKLCRFERQAKMLRMEYTEDHLFIRLGSTTEAVDAQGSWTKPVFVDRKWGEALTRRPYGIPTLTLSVAEGKIRARDFSAKCVIEQNPGDVDAEEWAERQEIIAGAKEALAQHQVTEDEIETLINKAKRERRRGWGEAERPLFDQVDRAWRFLATYGIEPNEIRGLVDAKMKSLFRNPPKRG